MSGCPVPMPAVAAKDRAANNCAAIWPSPATRRGILTLRIHHAEDVPLPAAGVTVFDRDSGAKKRWKIYAVLETEMNQIAVEAPFWGTSTDGREQNSIVWIEPASSFCLEAASSSKLTISLLAVNRESSAITHLDSIQLDSVTQTHETVLKLFQLQHSRGKLWMETEFIFTEMPQLGDFTPKIQAAETELGKLMYATEKNSQQKYALVAVRRVASTPLRCAVQNAALGVMNPFIARLAFAYESDGVTYLLSPISDSTNLFVLLQRHHRFSFERTRRYGAELVCAIDWLHRNNLIASLRPENVMLDLYDHIFLCLPSLYVDNEDLGTEIAAEYPAPELLGTHMTSHMADWWTLGLFMHEMITGLPLFPTIESSQKQIGRENYIWPTVSGVLIPAAAQDLLSCLLQKDQEQRLGFGGVSEIKDHVFFNDVTWQDYPSRDRMVFRPDDCNDVLCLEPRARNQSLGGLVRRISQGYIFEQLQFGSAQHWQVVGRMKHKSDIRVDSDTSCRDMGMAWTISWEPLQGQFLFSNSLTNESRLILEQAAECGLDELQHSLESDSNQRSHGKGGSSSAESISLPLPSTIQLNGALAIAIKLQCNADVINQILDYGIDLNAAIIYQEEVYDTYVMSLHYRPIPFTPIEWAVVNDRPDLVRQFLQRGALATCTFSPRDGPALVKAALRGHIELVSILVPKTGRVASTRALCMAVEQGDKLTAEVLLKSSVECEFRDSDWPYHEVPGYSHTCYEQRCDLYGQDFTPPLVRAVRINNLEMVKLLLSNGADPNVGYHDLCPAHPREHDPRLKQSRPEFSCGRPIQLAMELGFVKIAQALIRGGADVFLPQPSPSGSLSDPCNHWAHKCPVVARDTYVNVTTNLRCLYLKRK